MKSQEKLINEIINNASIIYSEFPMKASKARSNLENYKRQLLNYLSAVNEELTEEQKVNIERALK